MTKEHLLHVGLYPRAFAGAAVIHRPAGRVAPVHGLHRAGAVVFLVRLCIAVLSRWAPGGAGWTGRLAGRTGGWNYVIVERLMLN